MSKKMLSLEEIESQAALELPDRTMPLVFVVIGDVLSGNTIRIPVQNNNVAAQVCAVVEALDLALIDGTSLTCDIEQPQNGNGNAFGRNR